MDYRDAEPPPAPQDDEALETDALEWREDFLEHAVVGLQRVGADGTILWANDAQLELLGCLAGDYVGRDLRDFHVDASLVDRLLAEVAGGATLRDWPATLRRQDSSTLQANVDANGLVRAGRLEHARCVTRDATSWLAAQSADARLAAIVASSNDAIVGKTTEGIITNWNEAAERLFGWSAEEAIGRPISLIVPPHRLADMQRILGAIRRGERVEHFETERIRKDGRIVHVSLTVSPMIDAAGRVVGASKIARDVGERRRQEAVLRQAHEQVRLKATELQQANDSLARNAAELELANAELTRFASLVSHDLRTPLRAIRQYADFIAEDLGAALPPETAGNLDLLRGSVLHAEQLIDGLLQISRMGFQPLCAVRLDLAELLREMLRGLRLPDGARVDVVGTASLHAEPALVRLAFQDLILNGLKFNESREPIVTVEVEDCPGERIVQVFVTDNGIGIDPRHRDRVFDVFERLHGGRYEGTGLGLSIVRKAVSRLGGTIGVAGAPDGPGTRFCVRLPSPA